MRPADVEDVRTHPKDTRVTKVDLPLWNVLTERERLRADAASRRDDAAIAHAAGPIHVLVYFQGDLATLTAAGFPLAHSAPGLASGQLSPAQIQDLDARPDVQLISLPQPQRITLDRSVPEIRAVDAWSIGVGANDVARGKGKGVVVGIIDSGIDIFHGAFRNPDGTTRILALWDQTFNYNAQGVPEDTEHHVLTGDLVPKDETGAVATPGRAPTRIDPDLNYGIDFTFKQINVALTAHPNGKDLPISLRDQPVGSGDDAVFHGTHVAGIAAGNGAMKDKCTKPFTYVGVAPQADLVIVKTGVGAQPRTRQDLGHAVRYIFGIAAQFDQDFPEGRPAVVNISLAGHAGPHNGFDRFALEFDRLTTGPQAVGHAIVVGAGNDRNKDLHAAFTIAPGGVQAVRVNLLSNTEKRLGLFGSLNPNAAVLCVVRAPVVGAVQQTPPQALNADHLALPLAGHHVRAAQFPAAAGDPDRHFFIDITGDNNANVMTGFWEVDFIATAPNAANIHLWVTTPGGFGAAIQPFGAGISAQDVTRQPKRPADWIAGTLSTSAASRRAIAVAAYNAEEVTTPLAAFSAQGPAPNDLTNGLFAPASVIAKPDIAAPGVAVDSARAEQRKCCLECDCCIDTYIAEQGTSQAAPHIAGVIALMLAQNPALTLDQIKTMLSGSARTPPALPAGWPPTTELFGAGRVDARAAVTAAAALEMTEPEAMPTPELQPEFQPGRVAVSWPDRVRAWNQVLDPHPAWHLSASLVSQHFDEVKRLIDTNRRIAALWHRFNGPALVRGFAFGDEIPDPPIPLELATSGSRELLMRFLTLLLRFGSGTLRADIVRYGTFAQALPGASWDDLDRLVRQNGGLR
jgi:subtilisin family serine protease